MRYSPEPGLAAQPRANAGLGAERRGGGDVARLVAALRRLVDLAHQARGRYRQLRTAAATRSELRQLDDRTLRDLGFARDEIPSIAAEASGQCDCTRVRVRPSPHGVHC